MDAIMETELGQKLKGLCFIRRMTDAQELQHRPEEGGSI